MQHNKTYWWIIAGTCFAGVLVAQACTVTTSSDTSDGGINAGGFAGTGTAGSAGAAATAGTSTAGTSGSSAAGGSGSGVVQYDCDPSDLNIVPTPYTSCDPTLDSSGQPIPGLTNDDCLKCVIANPTTCADYKACYGAYSDNHGDQCGYGSQQTMVGIPEGEFYCYYTCMLGGVADAGSGDADVCSTMCVTLEDNATPPMQCPMSGSGLGIRTQALISDLADTNCSQACGIAPSATP